MDILFDCKYAYNQINIFFPYTFCCFFIAIVCVLIIMIIITNVVYSCRRVTFKDMHEYAITLAFFTIRHPGERHNDDVLRILYKTCINISIYMYA